MTGGSCGSGGCGGCGSNTNSGGSGGGRMPFFRFRAPTSKIGIKLAKLPRPIRMIVLIMPLVIVGRAVSFVRRHYIPEESLLPKAVEGTEHLFAAADTTSAIAVPAAAAAVVAPVVSASPAVAAAVATNSTPVAPAAVVPTVAPVVPNSRSIFGHRTVPVTDPSTGAIVGYRFAM